MIFQNQPLAIAPAFLNSIEALAAQPNERQGGKLPSPKNLGWRYEELIGLMWPGKCGPLTDRLLEHAANDAVSGVLFFIDSPGGTVAGTVELAEAVRRVAQRKPIVVYSENYLASGAM